MANTPAETRDILTLAVPPCCGIPPQRGWLPPPQFLRIMGHPNRHLNAGFEGPPFISCKARLATGSPLRGCLQEDAYSSGRILHLYERTKKAKP